MTWNAARRWGYKDVWLHTEVSNTAATGLYESLGYREMKRDPGLFGPFQRILFRKELQPCKVPGADGPQEKLLGSTTNAGTYLWDVTKDKSLS